jgi:hypothetical protein
MLKTIARKLIILLSNLRSKQLRSLNSPLDPLEEPYKETGKMDNFKLGFDSIRFARILRYGFFIMVALFSSGLILSPSSMARSVATPWTAESTFQSLVYGASSPWEVQTVMGQPPDQVVKGEQMYPLIENYYYFEEGGTGAATLFVFENNRLVGLHFKSADNQLVDLTYFLINNGDRYIGNPAMGPNYGENGFMPYFFNPQLYHWR